MQIIRHVRRSRRCVRAILVVGLFASFAATASAASAAQWYVGGLPLSASATYTGVASSGAEIEWAPAGTAIRLKASRVEVITSPPASIFNSTEARGSVKLRFSGVKVLAPSTCSVNRYTTPEIIETEPLSIQLKSYLGRSFERLTGPQYLFTFELSKGSGGCQFAGTYGPTGSLVAEVPDLTSESISHVFSISTPAAKRAGLEGPSSGWQITTAITEALSGANSGNTWSAK